MPEEGVLGKSINSGKWLTIGYILQKFIGFFSFLILARLLSPKAFGLMTFILLVPKFLQSATETGMSSALIQRQDNIKKYLNPIWTIGILKAFVIFIIIFISGPFIAIFFNVENASAAIRLGGIFILIQSFSNIGEVYFFKNLNFKKVFIRNILRQISYVVFSVISVFILHSYWALVIGNLALYLTQTISTYILQKEYRPKLSFKFKKLLDLFGYSKWIVGQTWLAQSYSFIENTVIGKLTNASSLGLYTKGKNLASIVPAFLSSTINIISFPAYSKLKDSTEKIKEGVLKSFDLIFSFVIPIAFIIVSAGGKLILIAIGEQWLPMTNVFRILLFFFIINIIIDTSYTLFNAVGKPDKKVKYESIRIILTIFLLLILTKKFGINGAALSLLFASIPILFITIIQLKNIISIKYNELLSTIYIPLLMSSILFAPAIYFKNAILKLGTLPFLSGIAFFCLFYLYCVYAIDKKTGKGPYKTIKLIIRYIKK